MEGWVDGLQLLCLETPDRGPHCDKTLPRTEVPENSMHRQCKVLSACNMHRGLPPVLPWHPHTSKPCQFLLQMRDNGLIPCPQAIEGIPCYGIAGEDFELDIDSIKRGIKNLHAMRAGEKMHMPDDAEQEAHYKQAQQDFRVSPGRVRRADSGRRSNSAQGRRGAPVR